MNWLLRFGMIRPMFAKFEDAGAPGGDPNNPDAGGGADDKGKAGGGGGAGDKGAGQDPPKGTTYELTVDGEKRQVTLDEMKALAQKSAGADKRFDDASKVRKDNADAIRQFELIQRLKDENHTPSEAEIVELSSMLGINPQDFAEYLGGSDGGKDDGKGGKTGKQDQGIDESVLDSYFQKKFGMTADQAGSILSFSHNNHINMTRQEITNEVGNLVEKDEFFGKMNNGDKGQERMQVIKEMVAEEVFEKLKDGVPYGAELKASAIQKVRATLTRFGIPAKSDQQLVTLGLVPNTGLPSEVQSDTPIKRVSAADSNFDDNFVNRAMQKGLAALRNLKS